MKFIDNGLGFVLGKLFSVTGNYGISIILLTILVKIIIYPLSVSAIRSQKQMQSVQPLIEDLKKKYKNDPQMLNQKIAELYKEKGFNPLSGCLPVLIQMPIIFALFAVLRDPVQAVFGGDMELAKQATTQVFLWIKDLSLPDTLANVLPFEFAMKIPGILPIMAAIFTYFQVDMSSPSKNGGNAPAKDGANAAADNMTKNMKVIFPIMILMSGSYLSSGVALYWAVSTGLQILQQMYLNKKFEKAEQTQDL